jgi:hypothetical protein
VVDVRFWQKNGLFRPKKWQKGIKKQAKIDYFFASFESKH